MLNPWRCLSGADKHLNLWLHKPYMSQSLDQLLTIMSMLRDPRYGCPWDLKQDFQSIASHTLEEVYEVVDAIDSGNFTHLPNELGDLLFQIVFYAQLGREKGLFTFDDIVREISSKLLTRHPHVFPDSTIESFGTLQDITPDEVEANWERIKATERKADESSESTAPRSILDDIPAAFPALITAGKLQKRAGSVGFDWANPNDVFVKLNEEIQELQQAVDTEDADEVAEELGDVLFTLVNLARHLKQDPESTLRRANIKFNRRFRMMERLIAEKGLDLSSMSLEEMETCWQQTKSLEE